MIHLHRLRHSNSSPRVTKMPKMEKKKPHKKQPIPPGPRPDLLKIDMDWKDAIKKSLEKKKPETGWPR